jgi:hypothetical protein
MWLDIQIQILKKDFDKWVKKYGEEFVIASISNELQLYADNLNEDVFEGHKEIYPELLREEER